MRTEFLLSELAIGLRRNLTMTIAAIVTITIATTLLGGAMMTRGGARDLQYSVFNQLEVSVYMQTQCGVPNAPADCLTTAEQNNIYSTLHSLQQVKNITYISPADAYERFKAEFPNNKDLVDNITANDLPSSFAVQLKDPHDFPVITSAVGDAPGVANVANASSTLHTLFSFFHKLELVILLITVVLLIASTLLIYNTMMVAAFTRRRETGIMRLVGASDLYIQAPFILEGTVIGLVGTSLAIGMLAVGRWLVAGATSGLGTLEPFGAIHNFWHALPVVVLVGILLPALASFFTIQRHLRV
ncbi:MAG TPA: permease-like cell division protein FtsX [Mycobacteriales bacterium]|nr:permease-like cell division protein FtsX [Mycobacteriales bacterium]